MRERRSLGSETNLFFAEFDGLGLDRGDCLVVRSPLSPGYCRGTFLHFGRAGVGRIQHVETHPQWRRRGLCSALVRAGVAWTLERRAPEERPAD